MRAQERRKGSDQPLLIVSPCGFPARTTLQCLGAGYFNFQFPGLLA